MEGLSKPTRIFCILIVVWFTQLMNMLKVITVEINICTHLPYVKYISTKGLKIQGHEQLAMMKRQVSFLNLEV